MFNEAWPDKQREKLINFLYDNKSVFAKDMSDLEGSDVILHKIETEGPLPRQRAYRHSPAVREEISRQTAEMLKEGIIEPSDSSALVSSSPILVSKGQGQYRMCIDYRKLNAVTKKYNFPFYRDWMMYWTHCLRQNRAISQLWTYDRDIFQLKLDPETKYKTTFLTHKETFRIPSIDGDHSTRSNWNVFGNKIPKEEFTFFAQVVFDLHRLYHVYYQFVDRKREQQSLDFVIER